MTDTEINDAVARKLGWMDVGQESGQSWISGVSPALQMQRSMMHTEIPDYCHSIAAAMEVVNHLREKMGYKVYLQDSEVIAGGWDCELTYGNGHIPPQAAETLPMAICQAFLMLDVK
jgi:hypothetical protein